MGTGDDPFGLVGVCLEGKYDIQAVVAEGGFGVVYRGVHRSLHKTIAVKVLKVPEGLNDAMRKEFLGKFAQEARTIAQFEHPAIVRVIDFGASPMPLGEAAPWMVLEWLQGSTLEDDFDQRRGHGRSAAEVLAVLRPIFEALAYAHDEGIAHRDIKPGNIMLVANRRGEVSAKLLDFGIAKFMAQGERASGGMTATRSALPAFSPLYAAPEQLSGSRTGPWTDVHAMALVVSEALVGGPVYPQDDNTALYAAVLSPTRPTPGAFGVQVGAWEPVLQRALAVRPDLRYSHMREFFDDLAHALGVGARSSVPPLDYGVVQVSGRVLSSASPNMNPDLHAGYGEEPTAQLSRAGGLTEVDVSPVGHPMPFAIAPTHRALKEAPFPGTLLPITQTAQPRAERAPSPWKQWAAVALLGVGVGALVFALSPRSAVEAPVRAGAAAPVSPVVIAPPAVPQPAAPAAAAQPAMGGAAPPRPVALVVPAARHASQPAQLPPAPAPPAAPTTIAIASPLEPPPRQSESLEPVPEPELLPTPAAVRRPPPVHRPALAPIPPELEPSLPRPASVRAPQRTLHHTEIPLQ